MSYNNVSRVTLIILIDSEKLVDQLGYTDRTIWLLSMRSVCAFTTRWFNAGTDIRTRYSFLYLPFFRSVFRFSLWRRHYLIMIFLLRTMSSRRIIVQLYSWLRFQVKIEQCFFVVLFLWKVAMIALNLITFRYFSLSLYNKLILKKESFL